uniref:epithelial-stromal interaction protein 1 isoform X2 n=1 Tax=Scatophagus argus TaxID=75038 RepID=UPI001ED847DF|nr:epithelial-stromal interaction protein 1 isoform X2 [Scatophagus argus]
MNPNHNRRTNTTYAKGGTPGTDRTADQPGRDAPESGIQQATDRQPRCSDGFTMIPPNESQRSKMKMMAQKEEEDLQRWKEANKVPYVHLNPERLGGTVTLAEARQMQHRNLRHSKQQKKLRKEELDKRRRQEEEEELQKMKTGKREMAEHLEERRRQEEQRRREELSQDHLRTNENFMQRFERRAACPLPSSSGTHTSSWNEAMASKQREESKSIREVQLEHKRVNSAFLDKLEGQGRGSKKETRVEGSREAEYPCSASDEVRHEPSNTPGERLTFAHLGQEPEQSCWMEEAGELRVYGRRT